jgi:hypothetical protein
MADRYYIPSAPNQVPPPIDFTPIQRGLEMRYEREVRAEEKKKAELAKRAAEINKMEQAIRPAGYFIPALQADYDKALNEVMELGEIASQNPQDNQAFEAFGRKAMELKQKKATYDQTQTGYLRMTKLLETGDYNILSKDEAQTYEKFKESVSSVLDPTMPAEQALSNINTMQQVALNGLYKNDTKGLVALENNFTKKIKDIMSKGEASEFVIPAGEPEFSRVEGKVTRTQKYKVDETKFIPAYKAELMRAQGNTLKTLQAEALAASKLEEDPEKYDLNAHLEKKAKTAAAMLVGEKSVSGTEKSAEEEAKKARVNPPMMISNDMYDEVKGLGSGAKQDEIKVISFNGVSNSTGAVIKFKDPDGKGESLISGLVTDVIFEGSTKPKYYVVAVSGNVTEQMKVGAGVVNIGYNERARTTFMTVLAHHYKDLENAITTVYGEDYKNSKNELNFNKPEKKGSNIAPAKKEEPKKAKVYTKDEWKKLTVTERQEAKKRGETYE